MSGFVCDLLFYEPGTTVTSATGPTNADGAIHVSVNPSNTATVRYSISPASSLTDPSYASRSNTSGNFTGLVPGNYVINARTNDSCKAELNVGVDYVITYNPRFRIQHGTTASSGLLFRVDIEDSQYGDAVIYITEQYEPTQLSWRNEGSSSIFEPLIGSELVVNLKSPTQGYFDVLNSFDEKRFRATYYVDSGDGYEQKWQGFLIPMLSSEPYCLESNYDISFTFTDGIGDLDTIAFSDNFGNTPGSRMTLMDALVFCLYKTGLRIHIWETINIYPVGISATSVDSMLNQVYFDPKVYLQSDGTMESCGSVLRSLLSNLSARLCQSGGVWMVDCPALKTGSATATRKFAFDGGSIDSADEAYRIMLRAASAVAPKILWMECSQNKQHQPMYGRINLTYDRGIDNENNVLVEGNFEDVDIENGQLKGWQIDNAGAPFVTAEIENINLSANNRSALKIPFSITSGLTTQQILIVNSQLVPMVGRSELYDLKFSFDALARLIPITTDKYAFIDYSIAFIGTSDTYYLDSPLSTDGKVLLGPTSGLLDTLIDGKYLRVYIDEDNQWKTFGGIVTVDPGNLGGPFDCNVQVTFRINCNPLFEVAITDSFGGQAALKAIETFGADAYSLRGYANRIRVKDTVGGSNVFIRSYQLEASTAAEDYPNIIVPDDNAAMRWILKTSVPSPQPAPLFYECWAKDILLDNVHLAYLPNQLDPEPTEVTELVLNANIKNTLELTFRHGDIANDNNYTNISKGWFSYLVDGLHTPTRRWRIRGASSPGPSGKTIMLLLQQIYQGQYGNDRWKLLGTAVCLGILPFLGLPVYEVRTGRIYILTGSEIMSKRPQGTIEMIEALIGAPVIDEGTDPDPDVEPPVSLREHTHEFTDEFA